MTRRNRVVAAGDHVTKTFTDPDAAQREIYWYQTVPWACPALLDHTDTSITVARHPMATATDLPGLLELLFRLDNIHISHRDVWPGNIVHTDDGPRLIDWETAIRHPGPSYDLYGPASNVPVPDIHTDLQSGYRMWLYSDHSKSVKTLWRIHAETALPARVGRQRPSESP